MGSERDELQKNFDETISKIQTANEMLNQLKQSNIMSFMIVPQENSKKVKLLDQDIMIDDLRKRMVEELAANLEVSLHGRRPEDILTDVEQKL